VDLFVYFLLGTVVITHEVVRKKYFKIDLITIFNLFFFLVYSFAPAALIIGGNSLILDDMPYGHKYFGHYAFTPYLVFLSYLFFLAGFYTLKFGENTHNWKFKFWWDEDTIEFILPFAYALLFFFLFIYVNEVGGLMKTIELAEAYRSGVLEYNKFGFVMKFFPLNTILLYYVYYKYFLEKKQNKLLLLYFILSLLFVVLFTVIQNSRGFLIFQLAGLYVITANYHKNLFLKYLIPTLISTFIVIKYGKAFFNAIQFLFTDGFDAFINAFTGRLNIDAQQGSSIISYFTHPIVSLEATLIRTGTDIPWRYFRDIKDTFLMILPNELLGIEEPKMPLMEQNTLILLGQPIQIVLPGILGYFSYAGHIIGLFLGSYLYGLIGVTLMKFSINMYRSLPASLVYIFVFSLSYGYFAFRGVPDQILNDAFMYIVIIMFLLFSFKLKLIKVKN